MRGCCTCVRSKTLPRSFRRHFDERLHHAFKNRRVCDRRFRERAHPRAYVCTVRIYKTKRRRRQRTYAPQLPIRLSADFCRTQHTIVFRITLKAVAADVFRRKRTKLLLPVSHGHRRLTRLHSGFWCQRESKTSVLSTRSRRLCGKRNS